MEKQKIKNGWVIASMNGTFILPYTFSRTRTDSIKMWMDLWDETRTNWRKFKREGYKCVRARQIIEIDSNEKLL